jgi:hypothetical protein
MANKQTKRKQARKRTAPGDQGLLHAKERDQLLAKSTIGVGLKEKAANVRPKLYLRV